ncbi:hypothetical protein U9R90_35680 [Streptomyces sp. E11-3]|uniref:hypothetical protein n=1 Tax=Streptomyces sp. E11-3 TaxID=3110112 RepID=UPI00397FB6DE
MRTDSWRVLAATLAVLLAAACGSGGGGGAQGGQEGGTDGATNKKTPTWTPPDNGSGRSTGSSGSTGSTNGNGGKNGKPPELIWLPIGPRDPNTDQAHDPESVYDLLQAPHDCATARVPIEQEAKRAEDRGKALDNRWRVLRGLMAACLAAQGQGGSWDTAAADYAIVKGRTPDTCKGRAALSTLRELVGFHDTYPQATTRLVVPSSGGQACALRITGVSADGSTTVRPGNEALIELSGAYFNAPDANAFVTVGGKDLDAQPRRLPRNGDRLAYAFEVPELGAGYPKTVDVVISVGGVTLTERGALTVEEPEPEPDAAQSPASGPGAAAR